MSKMLQRLMTHTRELVGVNREKAFKSTEFTLLDESSLDIVVRFPSDEVQPLLLRCYDAVRERLVAQSPGLKVSDSMQWGGPNWKWTEVPVDGQLSEATIAELIDASYQIVVSGLKPSGTLKLNMISRRLSADQILDELIEHFELSHRAAEIASLRSTAFLLSATRADDRKLPIGGSKLGGRPDLPRDVTWPASSDGRPLAFLAQLNLAELPATKSVELPATGILYLFSAYGWTSPDGTDPAIPEGQYQDDWSRILYSSNSIELTRHRAPRGVNVFKAASIDPIPVLSIPKSPDEPAVRSLNLTEAERERYDELTGIFTSVYGHLLGNKPPHLLLGFADYVQCFVDRVADDRLRMIFQVAYDPAIGMCWGDGGNLYFWIPAADLSQIKFDHVFADYQCG